MVQLLIVRTDGEVHEIKSDKTFRELLDPKECYIINDDDRRVIYLWKGSECSVRKKFIGASKSQEVRGQVGMHYKVIPVDEGDEPEGFLEFLDESPSDGLAREIREEKELGFEVPGVNTEKKESPKQFNAKKLAAKAAQTKAKFGAAKSKSQEIAYENTGPLYKGDSSSTAKRNLSAVPSASSNQSVVSAPTAPSASTAPKDSTLQVEDKLNFKKILETLESLEVPPGYEREMIIIGNSAYSIVEKKVSFLGQEKVEKVMERIGSLPEGVFFAKGYAPRVLCENQKVLAIEFLKAKKSSKPSGSKQKLKIEAKDPNELMKKFGMNV
ncbi:MAG: hypothetical protein ACTSRZ_13400 [Promethearchaeota archaeon]